MRLFRVSGARSCRLSRLWLVRLIFCVIRRPRSWWVRLSVVLRVACVLIGLVTLWLLMFIEFLRFRFKTVL